VTVPRPEGHGLVVTSALPVDGSPVLDPVDDHNLGVIIDCVDDSVVAAASGVETGEFTDQSLARSLRVFPDRSRKSDECRVADLCWECGQLPETLRGDSDVIHRIRYLAVEGFRPPPPQIENVQ